MTRSLLTFATLASLAAPLAAQGRRGQTPQAPAPNPGVAAAIATITEADFRRRVAILADDSMRGRATPSPELEETAQWIAGEFQRFGLRGGGDNGSFIQRYPIKRSQLDSASFVMAMGRGAHGHWPLGRDAGLVGQLGGDVPSGAVSGPMILVVGTPADTARPFGNVDVRGAIVLHVYRAGAAGTQALVEKAREAGARGWILLSDAPAQQFRAQRSVRAAFTPSLELDLATPNPEPGLPIFIVRDSSALGVLTAAGENLASLRSTLAASPAVRALPGFAISYDVRYRSTEPASAPNVIGVLEGSDPALKNEFVVYSGHMDHVGVAGGGQGCQARGADSICNGADDDASGTTGVIMLAQAFSQMNPRPRRSIVFMTVSGEERGLWGSRYYSERPTLPLAQTVANINLDMIGRYWDNRPGWRDTISVIGKEHSTLGQVANRVTQEHPELHMQLVDDMWPNENFYGRSDHYNFARKGVPIIFFFNGTHPDYHGVFDTVDKIDAEKAARIVQMAYYVGLEVANATERPQWNPESRRRIVQ